MSYEIVYAKQFIKTEDGRIIPLALHGSNNCYDVKLDSRCRQYERRERSWSAFCFNGSDMNIAIKPEDIVAEMKKYAGSSHYDEFFKMNGKWVGREGFIKFFENGIKNAMTIEDLSEKSYFPIYLEGGFSVWYKTNETYNDGTFKTENKFEIYSKIGSSKELTEFLKAADERIANKSPDEAIYVCLKFPEEKAIPYPKNKKKRTAKEKPLKYWTIKRDDGAYLKRLTKTGATLSYYQGYAKVFKTEELANKYIEEKYLNTRFVGKYKYTAVLIDNSKEKSAAI
ncbi:MAG TPA: hypothetical protein DCS12_01255 [Clostridiales bacterium]|nr:hypothetical protein [Clostridiales bacterium]